MRVEQQSFGKTPAGTEETLFVLTNAAGAQLKLTSYGARIVQVNVPDRQGKLANVNLGFDTLAPYIPLKAFFGCTTGRFANRIAKGQFTLEGKKYQLATNNGTNHLHGGLIGFDRKHWAAKTFQKEGLAGVEFTYRSEDGEEGYPGNLDVKVTYTWSADSAMTIEYEAQTDKTTILNLTNHAYWNLGGIAGGKPIEGQILNHELMVAADEYLPTDEGSIPLGKPAPVKGTVWDFTTTHKIGERIDQLKQPPSNTKGYDHCYVLRGPAGKLTLAALVTDPQSGRTMEVLTTEPGIQLYCGNFLDGQRTVAASTSTTRSAWKPSICRTHPINRRSPPRC